MDISPIVTVDWLQQNMANEKLLILDATIPKVGQKWDELADRYYLPGTRFMSLKRKFCDLDSPLPNTVPTVAQFTSSAQALGIDQESVIVVYDVHGIYSSPRAYWLFSYMGHRRVAVLDGGLPAWQSAGYQVVTKPMVVDRPGNFVAKIDKSKFVDYQKVLKRLNQDTTQIVDARSSGRFTATIPEPRAEIKGGHIPGSTNIPYAHLMEDGKLKRKEVLREIFAQAGVENSKNIIYSCGSGITACVLAWAAEVAGYHKNAVYDGSWTEWGGMAGLPVEKGD